jgi:phosphate starvation-inducible protein PhoH
MEHEYIKAIPVNFARGLTFHKCAVIVDESQNYTKSELATILSRFGRNSKYFVIGDTNQADIKDSGFKEVYDAFDTDFSRKNEIHCLKFDHTDIVRSPILRHITQVLRV